MNTISKFQQGGSATQAEFIQWLAAATGAQSQEQLEQIVQQLGEEGLAKLQQMYSAGVPPEQVSQMLQKRRNGGVINWYRRIMNIR